MLLPPLALANFDALPALQTPSGRTTGQLLGPTAGFLFATLTIATLLYMPREQRS
jgi:hypothetical protein